MEHDRGCPTSLAGGDCRFVAGEIVASQEIEPVRFSRRCRAASRYGREAAAQREGAWVVGKMSLPGLQGRILQLTANCRSSGTCPGTHPGTRSSAAVPEQWWSTISLSVVDYRPMSTS